ncbi:hypothetical protein ACMFMG_008338 [Clarireedia jacksonii]
MHIRLSTIICLTAGHHVMAQLQCIGVQNQSPLSIKPSAGQDNGPIMPLSDLSGTGLIPSTLEAGLISTLGHRFINKLYANISEGILGSCWSHVSTIAMEIPCFYWAGRNSGNYETLMKCGVAKENLCKLTDCLPSPIDSFVLDFCVSDEFEQIAPTSELLGDWSMIKVADFDIRVFLGIENLSTANAAKAQDPHIVDCCAACQCCVGLCNPFGDGCWGYCCD